MNAKRLEEKEGDCSESKISGLKGEAVLSKVSNSHSSSRAQEKGGEGMRTAPLLFEESLEKRKTQEGRGEGKFPENE